MSCKKKILVVSIIGAAVVAQAIGLKKIADAIKQQDKAWNEI